MRRDDRRGRAGRVIGIAIALAATLAGGCESPPAAPGPAEPVERPAGPAPAAADLREREAARLGTFRELEAGGVVELTWEDEEGEHWEQGNVELAVVAPDRTALAVRKVGETFLWLGSDEDQVWLFDLRDDDERIAYVGAAEEAGIDEGVAGVPPPGIFLVLAGLRPPSPAGGEVTWDPTENAWALLTREEGATVRRYFEPGTLQPRAVEILGPDGEVRARSDLDLFEAIPVEGAPRGAWPRIPRRIVITRPGAADRVQIELDAPEGTLSARKRERQFDLDLLMRVLRPHRVEPIEAEG